MELRQRRGVVTPRQGKDGKEGKGQDEKAKVARDFFGKNIYLCLSYFLLGNLLQYHCIIILS
jgi:hypothetical protein